MITREATTRFFQFLEETDWYHRNLRLIRNSTDNSATKNAWNNFQRNYNLSGALRQDSSALSLIYVATIRYTGSHPQFDTLPGTLEPYPETVVHSRDGWIEMLEGTDDCAIAINGNERSLIIRDFARTSRIFNNTLGQKSRSSDDFKKFANCCQQLAYKPKNISIDESIPRYQARGFSVIGHEEERKGIKKEDTDGTGAAPTVQVQPLGLSFHVYGSFTPQEGTALAVSAFVFFIGCSIILGTGWPPQVHSV